ncbi:unnamed protein product [Notodromas monacha]|uniref:STAS domain-containing protein n=1 Tax=Notodromas monacha TaxID=399045 RepID=A0A7R9GC47_9CRUS|nr:unnamed protein product [Notodromas monacha]CAG0917223.1 unnamed protein product [Notodromas monacha]
MPSNGIMTIAEPASESVCVELISNPVTSGFASAAAVIIACSQLKSLLGLKDIHGERLIEILQGVAEKLHATNFYDLGMGITAILLLTALKSAKDVNLGRCIKDAKVLKITEKIVWVVSTARNVLIVVLCGLVAVHVNNARGEKLFTLTSTVKSGIPNPAFPPFSIEDSFQNDSLTGETNFVKGQSYFEILSDAGSAIVIIPLLGILELIAICKTFAKGKPVDANQEMIALGMCQIAGAFFQSMPITGSFSRCAVNGASGVKTPLGGLYTGVIVLLALGFLTPYFEFIPRAALAAIIVCAVIYMIEIEEAIHVWRTKKIDLVPMLSTFFACLVIGIEIGILIGVAVNASMIILFSALPKVSVTKSTLQDETAVIFLTPDRAIHFLAVEKVRNLFSKTIFKNKDAVVVLDFQHVIDLDFTAAKGFVSLSQGMKERKQNLVFVNVNCDVEKTLHGLQANMEIYQSAADWISQTAFTTAKVAATLAVGENGGITLEDLEAKLCQGSNGNNAIAIPMDAEKHNQV